MKMRLARPATRGSLTVRERLRWALAMRQTVDGFWCCGVAFGARSGGSVVLTDALRAADTWRYKAA